MDKPSNKVMLPTMSLKVLVCHQCRHVYKWIDERMPTFCPECGVLTFTKTIIESTVMLTYGENKKA